MTAPDHHKDQPFKDDRSEQFGVNRIHRRIVAREQGEPEEGFEPPPWWLWTISTILLFAMEFYLGKYSGTFSNVAHEVEEPHTAAMQTIKREVKGEVVFAGVCQACHQSSGLGLQGQYPPLAGSEWLNGDAETPIRIVLHGIEGEIRVKGSVFNNKMPHFDDKLSNEEIAAVLTYARSSWGNKSGAVTATEVDSIRSKTGARGVWSSVELEGLRRKK